MKSRLLDGEALARNILATLRPRVQALTRKLGRPPLLAIVSIGEIPASKLYARRQAKACSELGIRIRMCPLPGDSQEAEVLAALERLGADREIDGIFLESPLPERLNLSRLADRIPPEKDVEGLGAANYGRLFSSKTWEEAVSGGIPIPPTAHAVARLLIHSKARVQGAHAVVIGRSNILGKPAAHLLSTLNATVTLCHSKTRRIREHLKRADIVVAALGRPCWIRGRDLKRGAVVVDAGINYQGKKLRGDVDFDSAAKIASRITPVPGGVGPVTTALLVSNVVLCSERSASGTPQKI